MGKYLTQKTRSESSRKCVFLKVFIIVITHLLLGLFQHAQRCNPLCIIQEQLTVSVYQITIDEIITQTKSICVLRFIASETLGVISKKSAELSFF